MRFENRLSLILESTLLESHKFSTTQIDITKKLATRIIKFGRTIPKKELSYAPGASGRETHIHLTCKYGLHTDDPDDIRDVFRDTKPFTIKLGKLDKFEADDYDVLIIPVTSSSLRHLNKKIKNSTKCTDTHTVYHPHITVAYLKKDYIDKYVGRDDFLGTTLRVSKVSFSSKDDEVTTFVLGG